MFLVKIFKGKSKILTTYKIQTVAKYVFSNVTGQASCLKKKSINQNLSTFAIFLRRKVYVVLHPICHVTGFIFFISNLRLVTVQEVGTVTLFIVMFMFILIFSLNFVPY